MRIGFLTAPDVPNTVYRAAAPADVLMRQGQQVEMVRMEPGERFDAAPLRRCDVVQVYRRADESVRATLEDLRQRGIAIVWDNDDDPRLLPEESRRRTGLHGVHAERDFQAQAKIFRRADLVTTTSALLADRYREAGASDVMVIENYLHPEQYASPRPHDGFVIGWVAGLEHRADAMALGVSDFLARVMQRHPQVHVVTIGVRLDLDSSRYTHRPSVLLPELKDSISQFDVGIAPLADIPMSHARSNVKVKEYAAAGVPWLASARGPYLGLGEREGGWLVGDDAWEASLEKLISSGFKRARLRRRAVKWAKEQALERHTGEWLAAFEQAREVAAGRAA